MKLSRRQVLGMGAVGVALGGCAPVARQLAADLPADISLPKGPIEPTLRWVNRISFGPTPGELSRVARLGHSKYLEEQLAAGQEEPIALVIQLHRLDALRMDAAEMEELPIEMVLGQLQQAAILRAVYSPNQLRERMVEFWSDHFNIYARKGSSAFRKGTDEANVIRSNALGNFHDLLKASAHSPAMLAYLDNQVNVRGVANENYARELMELHTLGVHGGYSQKDVQEVARCFTGWGIENRFLRPKGKFVFDPDRHDFGAKTVLGHGIAAGGDQSDGDLVLGILANHPNTAKFISMKLCRFFLGQSEGPVEDRVAEEFIRTKGDIKSVVRCMFREEHLRFSPPVQKRPFDYIVSSLRAVGAQTDGGKAVQDHLEKMGMPLYQWPMPDGYPVKPEAWTGTLLARWNFASALAKNTIQGTVVDLKKLNDRSKGLIASIVSPGSELPVQKTAEDSLVASLSCPDFQWR
jgi:uncharacterized protein (DUF1800 family)